MRITLISWFDNAQQLQLLAGAIRKYTEHDALHLNIRATYLDYEKDLYYPDYKQSPTGIFELKERIRGYDDFFIFSEFLPDDQPLRPILEELGIYQKLARNNVIIRTGGSVVWMNPEHYLFAQLKRGWTYTGAYHVWRIASQIGFVAPTRNICPIDKIPNPKPPKDKIRVAFSPTKKEKGVDEFSNVMDTVMKEYDNVEAVPITGKSWKESVKIKSEANVTFDQFLVESYGNSAQESMYLSHAVLSKVDSWTYLCYPDLPIINTSTERAFYEELKFLIENPEEIKERGRRGKIFIETHHSPEVVVKQWVKLIEQVKGL